MRVDIPQRNPPEHRHTRVSQARLLSCTPHRSALPGCALHEKSATPIVRRWPSPRGRRNYSHMRWQRLLTSSRPMGFDMHALVTKSVAIAARNHPSLSVRVFMPILLRVDVRSRRGCAPWRCYRIRHPT